MHHKLQLILSIFLTSGVLVLPAGGQVMTHAPTLGRPAGITLANDTLFLVDSDRRQILSAPTKNLNFELFVSDPRFKQPSGIVADGKMCYVADPGASAIFSVDVTTREVSFVWQGPPLEEPTDIAITTSSKIEDGKVTQFKELVVIDPQARKTFSVELNANLKTAGSVSWHATDFLNPSDIAVGHSSFMVTDKGDENNPGGVFLSHGTTGWISALRRIQNAADPGTIPSAYFHTLRRPNGILLWHGLYYVLDESGVYALAGTQSRPVHIVYELSPVKAPHRIVATEDRLVITNFDPPGVVSWPLIVPIMIDLRARIDTSEALTALYGYLSSQHVLPMVGVEMPYLDKTSPQPGQQPCALAQCVIARRKILVSPYVKSMDDTLCVWNTSLCKNGKWNIGRRDTLFVPEVPYEKYLGVDKEVLDGDHTVQEVISQWIPRREDPGRQLRGLINARLLRLLNPQINSSRILSLKSKRTIVNIPTLHYRYFLAVPHDELANPKSEFWHLQDRYREKFTVFSMEATGKGNTAGSKMDSDPGGVLQTHFQHAQDEMHMPADVLKASNRGQNENILIYDEDTDSCNPVFFDDSGKHVFSDECQGTTLDPKSNFILLGQAELAKLHYHGTCVSSIIAARRTPYGEGPASHSSLKKVNNDVSALDREIMQNAVTYKNRAVVNISREATEQEERNSWQNLLTTFPSWATTVLFVASAGNDDSALDDRKGYPAYLAPQLDNLISVGALNYDGTGLWRGADSTGSVLPGKASNYGQAVELLAPGENIPCAIQFDDKAAVYSLDSGTSMATPLVSAVGALLLESGLTPAQAKARLLSTSTPVNKTGNGEQVAYAGILNARLALKDARKTYIAQDGQEEEVVPLEGKITFKDAAALPEDQATTIGLPNVQSIFRLDGQPKGQPLRYRIAYLCRVTASENCGITDANVHRVKIKQQVLLIRYNLIILSGHITYRSGSDNGKVFIPFGDEDVPTPWSGSVNRKMSFYIGPIY